MATLTTFGTRDRNKAHARALAAGEKRRTPAHRIDEITELLGADGLEVRFVRFRVIGMTIDGHDALAVDYRIRRPGGRWIKITIVTANIGRGVPPHVARANLRKVLRRFRWIGARWWSRNVFVCLQEIDDDDRAPEYQILDDVALKGSSIVGRGTACPEVVPKGWRVVTFAVKTTSEGRAGLTPHRVAVVAVVEHERTGIRFRLANGQWPRDEIADLWAVCDESWRRIYAGFPRAGVDKAVA